MSKEIRGLSKDELQLILDFLTEYDEGSVMVKFLIDKISKQLKNWNGVNKNGRGLASRIIPRR